MTNHPNRAAASISRKIIRTAAIDRGCRYRITTDGEVHFFGRLPNSIEIGWWLFAQSIPDAVALASPYERA